MDLGHAEFDPTTETHHPLLLIKAVEPGCTTELQIEDARTGRVVRLTSTDDPAADEAAFEAAVLRAWRAAWPAYAADAGAIHDKTHSLVEETD